MFKHILIEAYCSRDWEITSEGTQQCNSVFCNGIPSYECLSNKCNYLLFTSCENALCYIGDNAISEKDIVFGGEMESEKNNVLSNKEKELWRRISQEKIDEAYDEYMQKRKQLLINE